MATSVLDVRDTVAPRQVPVPGADVAPRAAVPLRRVPAPALAAGLLAVLQAVGLLAAGLTRTDGVLSSAVRPPGLLIAGGLVVLAGWIVLSAAGGAALIDGADRRMLVRTSLAELVLVAVAVVLPAPAAPVLGLPMPVAFAAAVSLPVVKLLLADSVSARRWVAQGPRLRQDRRPDPVARYRVLCAATLGVLALGLGALAVLAPVQPGADTPTSSVVGHP